jgi:hypothetical protein
MMEIEQLEKKFQLWNRFMYTMLGSSITLVLISFGTIVYGTDWPGFGNYVGGLWPWIQILATAPGFFLLLGKRWKTLPFVQRLNTIFGYFIASWLSFLALGLFTANDAPNEMKFLIGCSAVLIALGYTWAIKKTAVPRDEIFP